MGGPGSGLWDQVVSGHATLILDEELPSPPPGRAVVMVPCDRPHRDLGAALEARRRIEARLGRAAGFWELAADRVRHSIRRRLLADEPEPERAWLLVEPLNRLQEETEVPAALVFDAVHAADPASLELFEEVVGHPGRAGAALVFVGRSGSVLDGLLAAVRRVEGPSRVVGGTPPPDSSAPEPTPITAPTWTTTGLPSALRRVARAAATVGAQFEAELVGGLLRMDPVEVLEALQELADLGAPLKDCGEGVYEMDPATAEAVRADVAPSLAVAWNLRIAELLGVSGATHETHRELAPARLTITTEVPPVGTMPDPVRAAGHLEAAGAELEAAESLAHAAREALALGAYRRAREHAESALRALEGVPGSSPRHGAARWAATSIDAFLRDDAEALQEAMTHLEKMQRALADADPAAAADWEETRELLSRLTTPSPARPAR